MFYPLDKLKNACSEAFYTIFTNMVHEISGDFSAEILREISNETSSTKFVKIENLRKMLLNMHFIVYLIWGKRS